MSANSNSFLQFMEKMRTKTATAQDVKDFVTELVSNSPYSGYKVNNNPTVEFLDVSEDKHGSYVPSERVIVISNKYIEDVLNGNENIVKLIDTIGHEYRHFLQHEMVEILNIDEKTKQEIKDSFYGTIISENQVMSAITVFSRLTDEEYFKNAQSLPLNQKEALIKNIVFADYAEQKHEEDARLGGILFAQNFFNDLIDDPNCSEQLKTYLERESANIAYLQHTFNEYKHNYEYIHEFEENLKNVSIDALRNLDKEIQYFQQVMNDHSGKTQYSISITAVLSKTMEYIMENSSLEDIENLYKIELANHNVNISGVIAKSVLTTNKFTPDQKSQFQKYVYDYLKNGNPPLEVFDTKYGLDQVLGAYYQTQLIKSYAKQNNVEAINRLGIKEAVYCGQDFLPMFDAIMPLAQQMNYALQQGKPINAKDYAPLMCVMKQLQTAYNSVKFDLENSELIEKSIHETINSLETYQEKIEEMTQENQIEQTQQTQTEFESGM